MDAPTPATTTTTTPLSDDQDPVLVSTRHGSGHVGSFFAVMSVILVLSALPCRCCGSRTEGPVRGAIAWDGVRGDVAAAAGCGGGEREAQTVTPSDSKLGESKQLSLPSPQQ